MKNKNKYIGIKELLEEAYDVMMHECINNCSACKYGKIVKGKETICDAHSYLYTELVGKELWNND